MFLKRTLPVFFAVTFVAIAADADTTPTDKEKDKEKEVCLSTYEQIQRERRAGHLVHAAELTQSCLAPGCPPLLRTDCESWRRELEEETPSVVVEVVTTSSSPIVMTIDGRPETYPMRGPLALDPGEHRIRVDVDGRSAEETVTLARRQRGMRVALRPPSSLAPTTPAPSQERGPTASVGAPFYVAGAVALTGFAVFGIAGIVGRNEHRDLEGTCGTRCSEDDADRVSTLYFIADVGLVAGLLSTGVAIYLGLR